MNCFFNGKIIPFQKVNIKINELGLLRGYAVFDYMRTYNGKPFRINDYLHRFRKSASSLRLKLNYSDSDIISAIETLLRHQSKEVGIRLLLTGGYTHDSMSLIKPNFFILIEKLPVYSDKIFKLGVHLTTCEFQRFLPMVKTTSYINAILLQPKMIEENAFEILFHNHGLISETARNNFFMVKNGVIITPKENILLGITRKVILELARKNKIKTQERLVNYDEIKMAEEAFISGSSKGIVPVVSIGQIKIANGKVGKLTENMMNLFEKYIKSY